VAGRNGVNPNGLKSAIIWTSLGPYHYCRLQAARQLGHVDCVEIYASDSKRPWAQIPNEGDAARVTLFDRRPSGGPTTAEMTTQLETALDRLAPDVLIVPSWGEKYALIALRWCLRRKVRPVVMTDTTARDKRRVWYLEMVKRRLLKYYQVALVSGRRSSRYLQTLGFDQAGIITGLNVVDNEYFAAETKRTPVQTEEWRKRLGLPVKFILGVFRLVGEKNLPGLVNAYAAYRNRLGADALPLVLVGDGPGRPKLEQQLAAAGLSRHVHLQGFRQYEEIIGFYSLATAFVLPSISESWGYVVNEAAASGLPLLVSTQCGSSEDLVKEGVNGWTFDASDWQRLSELFELVTRGNCDLAAMGAASRAAAAEFCLPVFARNYWEAVSRASQREPVPCSTADAALLSVLIQMRN
jgi:glycosyltransferase involved in cell wall biosynthesis